MKILNIVGARPNFIKLLPLLKAARQYPALKMRLIHTGQHYDDNMSRIFFEHLNLPAPDVHLGIGSDNPSTQTLYRSGAGQTSRIMMALEKVVLKEKPDLIIVMGDVNSTLAASLVAVQSSVPLAHIEAGLRSFDRTMPEEINRVVTDTLSDLLFAPSSYARKNLRREGISAHRIFVVGNIMIDTLDAYFDQIKHAETFKRFGLTAQRYALLTLHRQANVDNRDTFLNILEALTSISENLPIIFPVHPRTRKQIRKFGLMKYFIQPRDGIRETSGGTKVGLSACDHAQAGRIQRRCQITGPLGYIDCLNLIMNARLVLTDSGGVQEETTALGVPCLTLRDTTEWLETVSQGTNTLVGTSPKNIIKATKTILSGKIKRGLSAVHSAQAGGHAQAEKRPRYWDGHTAQRILKIIAEHLPRHQAGRKGSR